MAARVTTSPSPSTFVSYSACWKRPCRLASLVKKRLRAVMEKEIIRNSRILIVDDQPENVLLLDRALRTAGYVNLESTTDSRKVLATFADFEPDLVAMDLRMPHLDGFALLKQLRSRIPAGVFVPVLVLTADNSRKAKQEALSL